MATMFEMLQRMMRGEVPPPPVARLRPIWNATLTVVGEVVKAGTTVSLIESTITDERGRLIARAGSTCMTLRGSSAEGR